MTDHLSTDQLTRFTLGELGDNEAVLCALHLDDCPLCAARCAAEEPLAQLFTHTPDPVTPPDLVACVLAAATQAPVEPHTPTVNREVLVGAGLLVAVALLSLTFGEPVGWFTRAAVFAEATSVAARAITVALPSSLLILSVPLFASAAAIATMTGPARIGRP